jgi:pimeloyl-ACP methyl ester carboxylesterase
MTLALPDWAKERHYITVDNAEVAYLDKGVGPTVLLIHGALLNAAQFAPTIEQLAGFRCISADLMGHGYTRIDPDQSLGMDHQAEMLAELIARLDVAPVHLVGSNSGGGVAQVLAVSHPDLVASLNLTNCDIHSNNPPPAFAGFMRRVKDIGTFEFFSGLVEDPELARSNLVLGSAVEYPDRLSDDLIRHFFAPFVSDREQAENLFRYLVHNDGSHTIALEPDLPSLTAPTTMIWGTGDPYFPIHWAHWLMKRIAAPQMLHVIYGAKLYMHFDRPRLVSSLLRLAFDHTVGEQ